MGTTDGGQGGEPLAVASRHGPMDVTADMIERLAAGAADESVDRVERGRMLLGHIVATQGAVAPEVLVGEAERAVALLEGTDAAFDEFGSALAIAASAQAAIGDYESSLDHCLRLADLLRATEAGGRASRIRVNYGVALLSLGAYRLSEDILAETVEAGFDEPGLYPLGVAAGMNLTLAASRRCITASAAHAAEEVTQRRLALVDDLMARVEASDLGPELRAFATATRTQGALILGDLDRASARWGDLDAETAHASLLFTRYFAIIGCRVHMHRGDLDTAMRLVNLALTEADIVDTIPLRALQAHRLRAELHERLGDHVAALEDQRRATELALVAAGRLPDSLVDQIGVRAELERRERRLLDEHSRLAAQANRDELTGLSNRRAFESFIETERARSNGTVHVLWLDLDEFKSINDDFGHAVGDRVIASAGLRIAGICRSSDRVFRYGGDEFVIVPQVQSMQAALGLARRLRSTLEAMPLVDEGADRTLTCSIGVAAGPSSTIDDVVAAADARLYEAKRAGRNRIAAGD